jgi:hypothetical protein
MMSLKDLKKRREYKASWYKKNQERLLAKSNVNYKTNKEEKLNYQKEYRKNNPTQAATWRKNNPNRKSVYDKTYRRSHRAELNTKRRLKRKNNPNFRLACNMRSRLRSALKGIKNQTLPLNLLVVLLTNFGNISKTSLNLG